MDRLGFDGVGLNEHHTTPHGLMISPNMMAAAASQRTKKLKFLILGNLLPIHNPLRIAEELAMADCLTQGGFSRASPAACRANTTSTTCRWGNRARGSRRPSTSS